MPSSARDFWFPVLLTASGLVPLFFAHSATGNARRLLLTITIVLFFAGCLSYIWGDPVRGPFANLIHPENPQQFVFWAGVGCEYPVSQLKDGIDFSKCISLPGRPIEVWIGKTWWSGLKVKITINGPDGKPVVIFDGQKLQYNASGLDVNYDDYALEIVGRTRNPEFQVVIAKDYHTIYVNARLIQGNRAIIMKDTTMSIIPSEYAGQPQYRLDRIFKYPSYAHQRERD
jgi:hypothetical protein